MVDPTRIKKAPVGFLTNWLLDHGVSETEINALPFFEKLSRGESIGAMSPANYLAFFNDAARYIGDDCLGLHIGSVTDLKEFGFLGLLGNACSTVRDSFQAFEHFIGIIYPELKFHFEEGALNSSFDYQILPFSVEDSRHDIDLTLTSLVRFLRMHAGADWLPVDVGVMHQSPGDNSDYRNFYGIDVRFNQPSSYIVFGSEILDLRVSETDPEILQVMREHAEVQLASEAPRENTVARVRYEITSTIGTPNCNEEAIAKNLFLSPRTLKRILEHKGTSFRQLKLDVMEELAKRSLIDTSASVSEIASKLGYGDTTTFGRAFRKLTKLTPSAYRKMFS